MSAKKTLKIWAFGDAHVGTDIHSKRESLADAIKDSENEPGFEWDIALNVGDMSGAGKTLPDDTEGAEVVRQFGALSKHKREDIYDICGNHDRSGLNEPDAWWFQKWIDPMGEHTEFSGVDARQRPYTVEGTWERYSFRIGNALFLMMSDRNELSQEKGRGPLSGNPSGVVSQETFEWWKKQVEEHQDSIVITAHHYVLKDTTVASGEWEGMRKDKKGNWIRHYHGYFEEGTPEGASYLYFVGGVPNANVFEQYLETHPGAISLWLGGHTHTNPDDTYGNKSHIETKWGVHFLNVAALSKQHIALTTIPMSRLLEFTEGSRDVRVRCFLHTNDYAPKGWYDKVERTLRLSKPFSLG